MSTTSIAIGITGLSRQQLGDRWIREADAERRQGRLVAYATVCAARRGHPDFEARFMATAVTKSTAFMRGFHDMQASLRRLSKQTAEAAA